MTPEEGLPLQGDDQGPASGQIQMARTASTHPKTGDDTRRDLWTLLAVTALVTVLGGIWLRKKYADIYGKADVTENGVNSNKLIFYKAAYLKETLKNRGRCAILYGMYRK